VVFVGGFWRRLAAGVVDGACLAPALLLLGWLASRVGGLTLPSQLRFESLLELFLEGGGLFYSLLVVVVIIILVYGFLFTVTTGATPGLRLVGLRVINVYGEPPQWWRALLRGVGLLLGTGLLGLGLLWVGFDREKRGLHDWLAGTYVIRASRSD
jgi:uncharacterized RDD family membrane protein YckC